jgi:hypothetical protein
MKEENSTSGQVKTEQGHTPTPWCAGIGDRLSDGGDCWVVDCEATGSIAEMQCPADTQEANALFIVQACNAHDALIAERDALKEALRETLRTMRDLQGMAFVGSHTPRDREPLLIQAKAADTKARAALALASTQPDASASALPAAGE